ncbi:hypothetical protein BU16DRAFT_566073 [Lophium mytilinum]|uniref:Uncharacterized protein n=1 Tax=Lophium mytilinum TaxID=390894 RepID=A0A6A6QG48_9PEZI|nr:hypothetical protein BU16DRAFT_566073 [Lophium mytilinum]
MAREAVLAILFGVLTLLVTAAGIKCKHSICCCLLGMIRRRRRMQRGDGDFEGAQPPRTEYVEYFHRPMATSPFELSRTEQLEWQRERDRDEGV